jgi:hypothetical protein
MEGQRLFQPGGGERGSETLHVVSSVDGLKFA